MPILDDRQVRGEGVQVHVELSMHHSGVARVVLQPGFVQDKVRAIHSEIESAKQKRSIQWRLASLVKKPMCWS